MGSEISIEEETIQLGICILHSVARVICTSCLPLLQVVRDSATALAARVLRNAAADSDQTAAGTSQPSLQPPVKSQPPPAKHVDLQMYEGLKASRDRLSKKVSDLTRSNKRMKDTVAERGAALSEAYDLIASAAATFENLSQLSQGATAGVQFGVDREGALREILKLQERLEHMQEVRINPTPTHTPLSLRLRRYVSLRRRWID